MLVDEFNSISFLSVLYLSSDWEKLETETITLINKVEMNKTDSIFGYVMHIATTYLGLIALHNDDIKLAKKHLINSMLVPTSPYLSSGGPNMLLAKKLLSIGEEEVVIKYIELCERNWIFPIRVFYIWKWKRAIKKGRVPNFSFFVDNYIKYPPKIK